MGILLIACVLFYQPVGWEGLLFCCTTLPGEAQGTAALKGENSMRWVTQGTPRTATSVKVRYLKRLGVHVGKDARACLVMYRVGTRPDRKRIAIKGIRNMKA